YLDAAQVSAPAAAPAAATPTPASTVPTKFAKTVKPTITGTAKVGKTLKVKKGTWDPKPDKFTYQWYAGSKAIKGATKASLKLTKKQKGKTILVKVTGAKSGLKAVTRASARTAKVKK
ncbi:MAG: hypothetical protein LBR32_09335, partial [Propionibacteriaceae bacterium]|nr:hypothetical protein [Propionibacteriaceae bacterium]